MTARPRPKMGYGIRGCIVDGQTGKRFELANSEIVLEAGPAGVIARIERSGWVDYAGPLPEETVSALAEVARE